MSSPICICGHKPIEHQHESTACPYRHCPCERYTEKVLDRSYSELQVSNLLLCISGLKRAHKSAVNARSEVTAAQFANPMPEELRALLPFLEIAEINLTATMNQIETVVDTLTEESYD